MTVAHAERAHALLGASKAEQWLNCPPSARLQENVPERPSEYAAEGILAHEIAELLLRKRLLPCGPTKMKEIDAKLEQLRQDPMYSGEMEEALKMYCDHVEELFMEATGRSPDREVLLEERLDFSEWVPDGFGTGDVVIVADDLMDIIDLKFGKGVPVSAVGNPQMRLYALGALQSVGYLYDIKRVRMTIVQPRLDNISSDILTVDELLEWAETVVRPAASLAFAGEGKHKPGAHCRWCKVKATCRARADANLEALAHEFQDPALLSVEEIGQILHIADQLAAWAKDVQDYAQEQAVRGAKFPGWKLVEGRSNRQITDKDAAKEKLVAEGYPEDDILKPRELKGITDLEKLVGKKKFADVLGDLLQKPPGKPVLVVETDPRPELNSVESDFENENFDLED